MNSSHPLDHLVEQDTFAEMLGLLVPEELVIAFLRLEGLSDDQIAALLDVDRATVHRRMEQALGRIVEAMPELGPVLRGRRHPPQRYRRPLERGWICSFAEDEPDPLSQPPTTDRKGEPPADDSPSFAPLESVARAGTR